MTSRFDPEGNPWIVQRDEIDVLEEELDDVYQTYERKHAGRASMERSIIEEQIATEEMAEDELTEQWGREMMDHDCSLHMHPLEREQKIPLKDFLHEQAHRDPLYCMGYLWSSEVVRFSGECFRSGMDRSSVMFRAYLNAMMIPIKLSVGHYEHPHDPFSRSVVKKEYELALTYLDRTLESVRTLIDQGTSALVPCLSSGLKVRSKLVSTLQHL